MQKLTILVGISGSGKSTYAKKQADQVVLSSDLFRAVIGKSEEDQTVSAEVFKTLKINCAYFLIQGKSVIIDATNKTKEDRAEFVAIAYKYGVDCEAIFFNLPLEKCKQNNLLRSRQVPERVIDNQFKRLEEPTFSEGFSYIEHFHPIKA